MARLSSGQRKALPASDFAGPDRSYPVPDKAHARDAKARASEAVNAGRMSNATEAKIDAKANAKLGKPAKAAAAPAKNHTLPPALKAHEFKKGGATHMAKAAAKAPAKAAPKAAPKASSHGGSRVSLHHFIHGHGKRR